MKKYISSALKLAVSLGIGIGIVVWFLGQMTPAEKQSVIDDIKRANYFWVAMPPIIGLVSNYFRSERWRLLLQPLGHNPGRLNTFLSVMIMYFLNLFFPRLGEVSRCGVLSRYEKVPLDKAIGTMVVERVVDVLCLGVVALILLIVERAKFLELYTVIVTNSAATFGDIVAKYQIKPEVKYSVFAGAGLLIGAFILYQIRKTGLQNIIDTARQRVMGLVQGLISIKDLKRPGEFVFHTVMIWVCYFAMQYTGFLMFPETAHLSLAAAGVALFFGGIAFSLTPGGLGLSPLFTKIVLGLYGVTGTVAISQGWVTWSVQAASVLVGGVISLALLAIINREPSLPNESDVVASGGGTV